MENNTSKFFQNEYLFHFFYTIFFTFVFPVTNIVAAPVRVSWEASDLDVGVGIDAVSEETRGSCIKFSADDFRVPVGGNVKYQTWNFELIKNRSEFEKRLNLSAAAKLSYGAAHGSLKATFANEQKQSHFSVYALMHIRVYGGKKILINATYTEAAMQYIKRNDMDKFHEVCGDQFVNAVEYGGEFFAVLEFRATSESQRKTLEATIEAAGSGGAWSGDAKVKLKETISKLVENSQLTIRGFQLAGTLAKISQLSTVEGMIAAADAFVESTDLESGYLSPLYAFGKDYKYVPQIEVVPNYRQISQQQEILVKLDELRLTVLDRLGDIDYVILHPEEFSEFDSLSLQNARNNLSNSLNIIYDQAQKCFREFNCTAPSLELATPPLPKHIGNEVYGPHETCGVQSYNSGKGPVCGDPIYINARSVSCGIERWDTVRDPACGVERWRESRGEVCGVEQYNVGTDAVNCTGGATYTRSATQCGSYPHVSCNSGDHEISAKESMNYSMSCPPHTRTITCREATSCRHPVFGVEMYKKCRHETFGVEMYKECAIPDLNIGRPVYKICRHENHGVETYPQCEHPTFGIREYKSCWHPR